MIRLNDILQGPVGQSITSPAADPGVGSLIQARFHIFVEIDHEMIYMVILLLPLIGDWLSVTSENLCLKYWLTP